MNAEDFKKIAARVPSLRELSVAQLHRILQAGEIQKREAGAILCTEGEQSTDMFILLSGQVVVRSKEVELSAVKTSDVIGEMSLITGLPRSATIEVVEDTAMLVIHKESFDTLMQENADLAARIYRSMLVSLCAKLRHTNVHLVSSHLGLE